MGYHYLKALQKKTMKQLNTHSAEQYSPVRDSSDEESKDGLLEKDEEVLRLRQSSWARYKNVILVQTMLFALYTLIVYLVASKIASDAPKGPDLTHCKPILWIVQAFVQWQRADKCSSSRQGNRVGDQEVRSWRQNSRKEQVFRKAKSLCRQGMA